MLPTQKLTTCKNCVFSFMRDIFSEDDYCSIDNNRGEMSFLPGETIIKQGSFVSQVFYIKKGLVKIVLEGSNERNTILRFLEDKQFLALPVLGDPDTYPFSAIAISECNVCVIRMDTLKEIMIQNEKANKFLLKQFHDEYTYLYQRIAVLSTRNNHGKLASALYYLSQEKFKRNLLNIVSRKDIAQLASISVESSNKILMELKNDGIIELDQNGIKILKPDLIKKLSTIG